MKQIKAIAHNINTPILGCVTFKKKNIFNRKNHIYVCKGKTTRPSGFLTVITDMVIDTNQSYVNGIEDFNVFNEGDIISISPLGEIIFHYEHASKHNAVFVTERCNHRCIMCPQPPVAEEKDKTGFNLKLISLF